MKNLRSVPTAAVVIALLAPTLALANDPALFNPVPSMIALDRSDPALLAIIERPASIVTRRVNAFATVVDTRTESMRIALAPGIEVKAIRSDARDEADGTTVWWGRFDTDDLQRAGLPSLGMTREEQDVMNYTLLVRNGDMITGEVRVGGQIYEIRPLHSGDHALTKVDTTRLPSLHTDHQPGIATPPSTTRSVVTRTLDDQDPPSDSTLDKSRTKILILYTDRAERAVRDLLGFARHLIEVTNRSFVNSKIDNSIEMAAPGVFHSDLDESLPHHFHLSWIADNETTNKWRNSYSADVVAVITDDKYNSHCGLGEQEARADQAYMTASWQCTGLFTFTHELGHIYGAGHHPERDRNPRRPYGHGYNDPAGNFSTIMGNPCDIGRLCGPSLIWSSPDLRWEEKWPAGTAHTHHNQRVIKERKAAVAAFR